MRAQSQALKIVNEGVVLVIKTIGYLFRLYLYLISTNIKTIVAVTNFQQTLHDSCFFC